MKRHCTVLGGADRSEGLAGANRHADWYAAHADDHGAMRESAPWLSTGSAVLDAATGRGPPGGKDLRMPRPRDAPGGRSSRASSLPMGVVPEPGRGGARHARRRCLLSVAEGRLGTTDVKVVAAGRRAIASTA